jgi:polyisoprenoid-binding protein YceI
VSGSLVEREPIVTSEKPLPTTRSRWLIRAPDSTIAFSVTFPMEPTASGHIRSLSGTIDFDEGNPTASAVDVTIDTISIDTGEPERDEHLRSVDFFDVECFPSITFKSHTIVQRDLHVFEV